MRRTLPLLFAFGALFPLSLKSAEAQNVLPLGDSITHGGQEHASYRYPLWFDLTDEGFAPDFVGTQTEIFGGGPPNLDWYPEYFTSFDREHDGYWGFRTDQIDAMITSIVQMTEPSIVLIHLGTNDIGQDGASGVINADFFLRSIVGRIRAVQPDMTLLLAQVIPIGPGSSYFANADQVDLLNAVIAQIASDSTTAESPIVLVDQNTDYDLDLMMQSDGIHPNLLGEQQMADRWRIALEPLLDPGNPSPTVTITSPLSGAEFLSPADIFITADAADANGSVTQVEFFEGNVSLGIDATEPYSMDWLQVPVGTYTLTAVATDDEDAARTSDPVSIEVLPAGVGLDVPVLNGSFESPVLADGTLASGPGVVGDWTFEGTANTFVGIFNPPEGSYPGAGGNSSPPGAEGANVAFLFNDGGPMEQVSATQQLSEVLLADQDYVLEVAIGKFLPDQPFSFSTYAGYTLELIAGTTVIASDTDTVDPNFGSFEDAIAFVSADQIDSSLLGLPLAIRLGISVNEEDRSSHFDNVRLTRFESDVAHLPQDTEDAISVKPGVRAFPNPSVGGVHLRWRIPAGGEVTATLFAVDGRAVWTQSFPESVDDYTWNGVGDAGAIASGVYFFRLANGAGVWGVRVQFLR